MNYLSRDNDFSSTQLEKLKIPVIHDFAAMLYALNVFNKSKRMGDYIYSEMKNFTGRINRHLELFEKHVNIKNNLLFFNKLVDFFENKAYNISKEQKS